MYQNSPHKITPFPMDVFGLLISDTVQGSVVWAVLQMIPSSFYNYFHRHYTSVFGFYEKRERPGFRLKVSTHEAG